MTMKDLINDNTPYADDPVSVQIRFELKSIHAQVNRVLTDIQGDTAKLVEQEIEKEISEINFNKVVRDIIRERMPIAIRQKIDQIISNAMWDDEVAEMVRQAMLDGFNKHLEKRK